MTKFKQVIIVRKDIGIDRGKLIVHCIHAALGAMRLVDKEIVDKWEEEGAKKVLLKVKDLKELSDIHKKLKEEKIPSFLVRDAGLTQLKPGTVTALGIGPYDEKKIDKMTRKLKLL